jgi:SAM-dependent methyltransferase
VNYANKEIWPELLQWSLQSSSKYGETYFEKAEYSGYYKYSWKPELITPFVRAILDKCKIKEAGKILDFGCAKGFYVKVLSDMGYNTIGIDISEYSLLHSPDDVRKKLFLLKERPLESFDCHCFDLVIAKDVLEHVPEFALEYVIYHLKRISEKIFITVPVVNVKDRKYINSGDEIDKTHLIRYAKQEWVKIFEDCTEEPELCEKIKRDKSKGTLCCLVNGFNPKQKD